MLNYGFNNDIGAANHASGDDWQARSEKNKNRNHTRVAEFGMPGSGDMQGDGAWRHEEIQMPEGDSVVDVDEGWEAPGQFFEVGNGFKIRQTAFWLDVVPGV